MEEIELIEDYFSGVLSGDEQRLFDKRLETDPGFAKNVAFYVSAKLAGKELAVNNTLQRFRNMYNNSNRIQKTGRPVLQLWPWLVAAVVIAGILFGTSIFFSGNTGPKMAQHYISENLQTLGVTMSDSINDLQSAIAEYNHGNFGKALENFQGILRIDSNNFEATKNAGIAALRMNSYDLALSYFKKLERFQVFTSPSIFYQALTLLKRDEIQDKENAKKLLQRVVGQGLEGSKAAAALINKL